MRGTLSNFTKTDKQTVIGQLEKFRQKNESIFNHKKAYLPQVNKVQNMINICFFSTNSTKRCLYLQIKNPTMTTKKILLVDDDKVFISAISAMLTAKGYETKMAHSAEEGFEVAQTFNPDLFILDVNMETFSAGFDLAKKLRVSEPFKTTPAIMLTGIDTMAASAQIVEMYNEMEGMAGFESNKVLKLQNADGTVSVDYKTDSGQKYFLMLDAFISKPVDSDKLLEEIKRFLKD